MRAGEYIRTKYGIEKITDIKEWVNFQGYEKIITTDKNQYETLYEQSKIIKSSSNIIDLIEEGDFINQMRVSEIIKKTKDSIRFMADSDYEFSTELKEEEIKSIITKECFESMEYKVKE